MEAGSDVGAFEVGCACDGEHRIVRCHIGWNEEIDVLEIVYIGYGQSFGVDVEGIIRALACTCIIDPAAVECGGGSESPAFEVDNISCGITGSGIAAVHVSVYGTATDGDYVF